MRLAALFVCLAATSAQANVWQRAIDSDATEAMTLYEAALTSGDEAVGQANTRSVNLSASLRLIDQGLASYRSAAKARPDQGEPHYRIASVLNHFFFECSPLATQQQPVTCAMQNDESRAKALVDAYDSFEKLAPLDPRVALILNQRAIVRTKMVMHAPPEVDALQRQLARRDITDVQRRESEQRLAKLEKDNDERRRKLLEAAARDYQSMIDHADSLNEGALGLSYGNLAETFMMVGKLEEAIDAYKVAMRARGNGGTSLTYGYAVALDRDEQGAEALRVIRSLPRESFDRFREEHRLGGVFYVPRGEEHYYFGLLYEAFGEYEDAIDEWQLFLKSGAHPIFQPRAKAHLDALVRARRNRPPPVPPPDPIKDFP
jgi:tetratricopeptide (TPR) repeat protein